MFEVHPSSVTWDLVRPEEVNRFLLAVSSDTCRPLLMVKASWQLAHNYIKVVVNDSLQEGMVPLILKEAVVYALVR